MQRNQTGIQRQVDDPGKDRSAWDEGVFARSLGACSHENPYLVPDAMPFRTGESQAEWFSRCDAWWRGWDKEDARRRSSSFGTMAELRFH